MTSVTKTAFQNERNFSALCTQPKALISPRLPRPIYSSIPSGLLSFLFIKQNQENPKPPIWDFAP